MNLDSPLPLYKKLSITFRVEPGCLGPDGAEHIDGFCKYAKTKIANTDANCTRWHIVPRYDKALAETEYKTNGKTLNHEQASLYLNAFGKHLEEFEEALQDKLADLIDKYLGR